MLAGWWLGVAPRKGGGFGLLTKIAVSHFYLSVTGKSVQKITICNCLDFIKQRI